MGKKKAAQLSHAEIWDDSALLQSWDEALAEYQAYHSIQARGEQVDDVLNAAKSSSGAVELGVDLSMQMRKVDSEDQDELEDGELEEVEGGVHQEQSDGNVQNEPANGLGNAPVPQGNQQDILASIINGVNDESLKNLMMSWYYAGYYTGLYEGQRLATNSTNGRPAP